MRSKIGLFFILLIALCSAGQKWSFMTDDAISTKPVVAGSTVITASLDGNVYCADILDGSLLWRYIGGSPIEADPVLAGGNVVFGNTKGHVIALNQETGESTWRYDTGRVYGLFGSPTILYVTTLDKVIALDSSTGALVWDFDISSEEASRTVTAPASSNTEIFVGANREIIALDALSGDLLWRTKIGRVWKGNPCYGTDAVYIGATDNSLYALDARTGVIKWTFTTDAWVMSTPFFYDNVVYFGSNDRNVYAINALNGELIWKFETGEAVQSNPAYYRRNLLVGGNDHKLYSLNMDSGKEIWSFEAGDWVCSPVFYHDHVFFGSRDGRLYDVSVTTMCSIDMPSPGIIIGNVPFQIEGRAYAENGVKKVQIQISSMGWEDAVGAAEWSYSFDPAYLPDGAVEIECRITDETGKMESAPYTSVVVLKSSAKLEKMTVWCPTEVDVGKKFEINVTGEGGEPLSDVTATVDGREFKGDGTVELRMDKGGPHLLRVSRVGYETAEITVTGKETGITIILLIGLVLVLVVIGAFFVIKKRK